MENINLFLKKEFFSNTIIDYLYFLGLFFVLFFVLTFLKKIIINNLKFLAGKTKIKFDDVLSEMVMALPVYFY